MIGYLGGYTNVQGTRRVALDGGTVLITAPSYKPTPADMKRTLASSLLSGQSQCLHNGQRRAALRSRLLPREAPATDQHHRTQRASSRCSRRDRQCPLLVCSSSFFLRQISFCLTVGSMSKSAWSRESASSPMRELHILILVASPRDPLPAMTSLLSALLPPCSTMSMVKMVCCSS